MPIEIELKAHVKNSETMKLLLSEKAKYEWIFEKEDTYWISGVLSPGEKAGNKTSGPIPRQQSGTIESDSPITRIRLRKEKRSYPDGTIDSLVFVTYKMKKVIDGIEINDEHEFEIRSLPGASSGNGTADFDEFLRMTGCTPCASKRKEGWLFSKEEINAELTKVEGLGWFIELEILAGDNREETVSAEKEKLLSFLNELGIEKEAIESRFYTEMLKDKL